MKATQIEDFECVQIIDAHFKRARVSEKKGLKRGLKKGVAFFIVLLLMFFAAGGYFAFNLGRLGKTSYYALVLDSAQTTIEAQSKADGIKNAGGSAYIINDGEFKVCGALYSSFSDAQSVLNRLSESYSNAQIVTLELGAIRVGSKLKPAAAYPIKLIDFLLELSVELDLLKTTEGAAILKTHQKKSEVNEFLKAVEGDTTEIATKLYNFYCDIIVAWEYLDSLDPSLGIYNHRIKYFSCLLAYKYYQLRDNLL